MTKSIQQAKNCFSTITNGMDAMDLSPVLPVAPLSPGFSLNPRRASFSITADLFSSLPQKDNITGIVKVLFVPEWTTLTQKKHNDTQT